MKNTLVMFGLVLGSLPLAYFAAQATEQATEQAPAQAISLSVTEKGFEPSHLNVEPGRPTILTVTRKTDATCAKTVLIPKLKIKQELPLNQPVVIHLPKLEKGEIKFTCGMKMTGGVIEVK